MNTVVLHPAIRIVIAILLFLCIILVISCKPLLSLGKNPSGEDLQKIERLPNYRNGQFYNLDTTISSPGIASSGKRMRWSGFLKYFFRNRDSLGPAERIPYVLTDLKRESFGPPTVIWFGHSTFLIKTKTANLLFDPNFSGYAGPIRGLITAYKGSNDYRLKDLPPIDIVVVSHDHYDHLDYTTIKKLRKQIKHIIVPSGVGSHLKRWGYKKENIQELYWNQTFQYGNAIKITATPAHHRSNRTFETRKTLWASYVIEADGYKIYFSGDTGYSAHFKLIGEQYGPFHLAMLECGQYNVKWPQSHMFPYQVVRAANDLKARIILPVHWGKFTESEHYWTDPVNLLLKSADSLQQQVTVPYIGQPYNLGQQPYKEQWWNKVK